MKANNRGFSLTGVLAALLVMGMLAALMITNHSATTKQVPRAVASDGRLVLQDLQERFTMTDDTVGVLITGAGVKRVTVKRLSDGAEFDATVRADRVLAPYEEVRLIEVVGENKSGVNVYDLFIRD